MFKLAATMLGIVTAVHFNSASAMSSPIAMMPDIDIEGYFCEANQPGLTTIRQAEEWFGFLASGRGAEIIETGRDGKPCSGTMQRMVRDGVWNADGAVALSQIIALAGFLESPPAEPEKRLAYDTEMLGWIVLACSTFEGEEQPCVSRAVRDISSQTISESPVFCGFSASALSTELKSRYGEYAESASFSICPAIVDSADSSVSGGDDWWSRVHAALFPLSDADVKAKNEDDR